MSGDEAPAGRGTGLRGRTSLTRYRPGLSCGGRSGLAAEPPQEVHGRLLVEGLVEVAALRGLDAGRAAGLAGARLDDFEGAGEQPVEQLVPFFGDADAAGIPVVDKDRRAAGLGVHRIAHPADIPPVAHRK